MLRGLCVTILMLSVSIGERAEAAAKSKKSPQTSSRASKGRALLEAGQYETALSELKAAYAEKPDFELLFDIAQCERGLKRVDQAARSFQEYLEKGGEKVSAERKSIVANELAMIQEVTALVTLVVPGEPADITIDSEMVGQTPFKGPLYVSPGEHLFSAFRQGQAPATRKVDLVAGKRLTVKLDPSVAAKVTLKLEAKPTPARVAIDGKQAGTTPLSIEVEPGKHLITADAAGYAEWQRSIFADKSSESQTVSIELEAEAEGSSSTRPKGKAPVAGLLITGVGVLAIGGSIALSIVAGIESREVGQLFTQGGRWDAYYDARQASGERAETWSVVAGVGGGLVLATGLIVTLATLPSAEPSGEVEVESAEQPQTRRKSPDVEDPRVFLSPLKEGGLYGGLSFRF
jgi:hypothetical protein